MKSFKLLFGCIIFCLLISCTSDEPFKPEDFNPQANLRLQIELITSNRIISSQDTEEVISDLTYRMEDAGGLLYIVHSATNEEFLKYYNLTPQMIQDITKDGVTMLEDTLPFGRYFITLVVTTGDRFEIDFLKGIKKKYSEAACQIPNSHIFYETMEVDCSLPESLYIKEVEEDITFNKDFPLYFLTGEFIFLLPTGSKGIPVDANFNMTVEVRDLPYAFFLKSGETLTNKELEKLELSKYNDRFEINTPFEAGVVIKYCMLANNNLEDSVEERGAFLFTYKEDAMSHLITKEVYLQMPEWEKSMTASFRTYSYLLFCDLYSDEGGFMGFGAGEIQRSSGKIMSGTVLSE